MPFDFAEGVAGISERMFGPSRPSNKIDWTETHTERFREEVERRFRERTPPKRIDETDVRTRVARPEMRTWALKQFGMLPPELDPDWGLAQAKWYRRMARKAIKELDSTAPKYRP